MKLSRRKFIVGLLLTSASAFVPVTVVAKNGPEQKEKPRTCARNAHAHHKKIGQNKNSK